MGLLCDYFLAPSDDAAAATLEGGPEGLPTLSAKNLEPTVTMGTLEELMTGKPFDEILAEYTGPIVTMGDEGPWVNRLTEDLTTALRTVSSDRLAEVAAVWAETEEVRSDPEIINEFLGELQQLAVRAHEQGGHLYCWVCL
jgi:hypothetical protein